MMRISNRALSNLLLLAVGTSAAGVLVGGCGSDSKPVNAPPPRAQPAGGSAPRAETIAPGGLESFRSGLVEGQQQIDATLASLGELTDPNQQNTRAAYDKYCDNLARMNEHADTMKREADAMRAARDEYFNKWEAKSSEIDNPTIRASAEARRKRLRDAHERIVTTSGEVRDSYQPFMKDLQDIKKFLATDQSKGAIADLGDATRQVQANGAIVKEKIDAVIHTLDSVQSGAAGARPALPPSSGAGTRQ
jgi:hypothetical protein